MDSGSDPHHLGGVSQGWRRDLSGRRNAQCVRPARWLLQEGRALYAIIGGRDRRRHRSPSALHRPTRAGALVQRAARGFAGAGQAQQAADSALDQQEHGVPGDALHCSHCFAKAVVALDNCLTCLNCGESKCG
ncbi:unnamed protein product [Phaeothamnion confervicola]